MSLSPDLLRILAVQMWAAVLLLASAPGLTSTAGEGPAPSVRGELAAKRVSQQAGRSGSTVPVTTSLEELGLGLAAATPQLRKDMGVTHELAGALVARVDPGGAAAQKRLFAGDMIIQVEQEVVSAPEDVSRQVAALREQGQKSALFRIVSAQGHLVFARIPLAPPSKP